MALKLSPLRVLLLAGASAVAVSTAAQAAPRVLFATGSGVAQGPITPGQPVTSTGGVTQVQLDSGAVVSFVGPSTFSVGADGALEIQSGNITLGGGAAPTLIRLAGGGSLNASAGASASFAITSAGTIAGQVMTGSASLSTGGGSQTFTSAQFFSVQPGGAPTQTFAGLAPQATPGIVGAGINIGGYNPILNAAIQQNPALTTLPLGQGQTQLANYLVALGQTIGQLFTPAQLLQLAAQYGPQAPTPTPTTPTPTPTTPTPTPTTPTPTPTTPTPTPTTPTPTPTTPTPTPTTPTPTPTTPTPTPTTPTPTPTTPNAAGLSDGQTVPAGAMGRTADNQSVGTGDAASVAIGVDASGNPNRFGAATVTTATLSEVHSAAGWTVGRYSSGNVERNNGATTGVYSFNANNGMSFFALTPVTGALPTTGVAIYDTLSATTPIIYDGATAPGGSFTARLGIDLGTAKKIGFDGILTLPQGATTAAYNFTTAGGAAAPSAGLTYGTGLSLNFEGRAPVTTTGSLCGASGCELFLRGSLGGADGAFAGAIYEMRDTASSRYPAGGAVVFSRTSVTTPTPTPTTPTPTPTTPTPTPTTPTPTPTTPTPTPTTPTPTPTTGVNGIAPPTGASNMLVAKAILTENAGYETDKATLALGAGSFDGYDTNGGLTQFRRLGSQTSAEYYVDKGVIGIARWSGGTGVLGSERGPTQGDHYVFGSKATALPTAGLFTFDLAAFTQPTIRNVTTSSTGNVTGRASVSFFNGTAASAGLDFSVLVNGSTYVVRSPGGITAPSLNLSNGVLTGNPFRITSGTGPACTGATCEVAYGGFLSGAGASNLGLVYTIYNPAVSTTGGRVDGAVLFGNPTTPTQTAAGQFNQAFMSRTTPTAGTEGAPLGSRGLAVTPAGDFYNIASIDRFLGSGTTFPDQFIADNGSGGTVTVTASSASGLNQGGYIGRMGWVRWNGRTVINGVTSDLTNVPIVWLTPLTGAAPTGRANYELIGATDPVIGAAQNGGSFKGALVVDFATSLVGWDSVLTMSGERLNFYSDGRLATPSVTLAALANGQRRFSGAGLVAAESLGCGGCTGTMTGLIGGPDASEAGVTYVVNSYFGPITGAAAFRREGGLGRITGAPVESPVVGAYNNGNQISSGLYTNTLVNVSNDGQARSLGDATRGTSSGAAKNVEFGGDGGQIGWTRWYDGTATVNNGGSRAYGVNNGVHLVWGAPVTNMPTSGLANYTLVGATKPTVDTYNTTTAPGEFAGTFAVDFASRKAGLSSTVTMGATVYNLASSGGSAAPSMAIDPANGTFAVSTTVNGQFGSIYGFLAGPGASHAGVSYRFLTAPNVYIGGVAAFRK